MVDCLTIDELLKESKIRNLDLIKIDVQGYESKVLKGMSNIVRSSKKLILLSEFWPKGISQSGENPKEYLNMLRKMKFQLFELKSNGSVDTRRIDFTFNGEISNNKNPSLNDRDTIIVSRNFWSAANDTLKDTVAPVNPIVSSYSLFKILNDE